MDAATLYAIVQLANGHLRTADAIPNPNSHDSCESVARKARYDCCGRDGFASLLLVMTLPDGSKKAMGAFPVPAAVSAGDKIPQ